MENNTKSTAFAVIAVLMLGPLFGLEQAPDPVVLNQERQLKEDTERQAQIICDSILGKDKSSVLVNVELGLESTSKGGSTLVQDMESSQGLGDDNYILPWVPAPQSVTKKEAPTDYNVDKQGAVKNEVEVKTLLRRFDITVIHDDQISEARVELTKETLKSAFQRYAEILQLYFRPTTFIGTKGYDPKETVKKNLFDGLTLRNFFLLFLLFLALWLLKFFFGPLAGFMKDYIENMRDQQRSRVDMENKSENENDTEQEGEESFDGEEGQLSAEELAELEANQEAEMEEKFEPFTYVTDDNVKQLAYLLHHEEPWIVALVISYLSSEHAYKVMEALPADLQAKVALETALYRQTSIEQVYAINEDIKEKIDFVVGGLEKLVGILESSDRFARDNILEYLKNEKPGLYEKVREQILLFDDVVKFPKIAMQVLVRELKTEELGKALRNASPELQQQFFENMSQGAASMLKEEIEFGRPVTSDQIEEERRKIVDMIKQMEADGKLSFRTKGATSALSGDEIAADGGAINLSGVLSGAGSAQSAEENYVAGVQALEQGETEQGIALLEQSIQGNPQSVEALQALANAYYSVERYPEAVGMYDQVLRLSPNEELQTWVDELRASLPAAA